MRKLVIIWLAMFLPLLLFGGSMLTYDDKVQVYRGPIFDSTDNCNFHIDSVKVTKDTTYVFCYFYAEDNSWANISDSTYLEDVESKEKYYILKSVDLPYAPEKHYFIESGYYLFSFLFPSIEEVRKFNFIEEDTSKAFNIYNVDLNNCTNSKYDNVDLDQLTLLKDSLFSVNDTLGSVRVTEIINNAVGYYFGYKSKEFLMSLFGEIGLYNHFDLYEKSITLADSIIEHWPDIDDKKDIELAILQVKAIDYLMIDELEEAMQCKEKMQEIIDRRDNKGDGFNTFINKWVNQYHLITRRFSDTYFKEGMELYKQGQYEDAAFYFSRSKEYFQEAEMNEIFHGYEYLWIASCYYKLGDEETASQYSDCYKLEPLNRFEFNEVDSILCVSDSLFKENFVYSAIEKIHERLSLADKFGRKGHLWKTYRLPYFIKTCLDKDQEDDALELCLLNLETLKEFSEDKSRELIQCYYDLFQLYEKRKEYHNAIKIGLELIPLAKDSKHVSDDFYPSVLIQIAKFMSESHEKSYGNQIRDYILKAQKAAIDLRTSDEECFVSLYQDALYAAEKTEDRDFIIELCESMIPLLQAYYPTSEIIQNTYFYVLDCLFYNYSEKGKNIMAEYYLNELRTASESKSQFWHLTALTKLLSHYCDRGLYGQASLMFEERKQEIQCYLAEISKDQSQVGNYGLFCYRMAWFYSYMGLGHDAIKLGEQALSSLVKAEEFEDNAITAGIELMKYYLDLGYWQDAQGVCKYLWDHYNEKIENMNNRRVIDLIDLFSQCQSDKQIELNLLYSAFYKSRAIYGNSHYRTLELEFKIGKCRATMEHAESWHLYMESVIESLHKNWKDYNTLYLQRQYYDYLLKNGNKEVYKDIWAQEYNYCQNFNRPYEDLLTSLVWISQALVYSDLNVSDYLSGVNEVDKLQKIVGNNIHLNYLLNEQSKMLNSTSYYKWHQKVLPQLAYYKPNDSINCYLYNSRLLNNNMQAKYEIEFRHKLQQSDDSIQKKYRRYIFEKNIVQKLNEDFDVEKDLSKIWSVQGEIRNLEMDLLKYYQENHMVNSDIKWTHVRDGLDHNEIAVEFIEFPDTTGSLRYIALTLKKNSVFPRMTPLFTTDEISNDKNDSILYQLIWKPLEKELVGVTKVYFSALGKLNYLPFENLTMSDGHILSDQYQLYRLSSTAEILDRQGGREYHTAALFGGIDYEVSRNKKVERTHDDQLFVSRSFVSRSIPDSLMTRGGFELLEGSLSEVTDIKGSLDKGNVSVQLFTDSVGTEKSLKDLSGQEINIMHFATHGMYMHPEDAEQKRSANNFKFISTRESDTYYTAEDKALTRSFLVMAGGNKLLRRDVVLDEEDDGVLTALEISLLDFRNLDLVVLSACQSGLGDTSIDGVVGLQRGFKKAGANTILMSLDKVDDEATKILMVEFYRNLMSGKTKYQSLKDAQKHLRKVENGKYDKPEYWASFIMLDGLN